MTWSHPLTHWTTHPRNNPCTHPMGGGLSTNHKSSNRIILIQLTFFEIFIVLTWPHPSTHPPTHQTTHPPMGGKFFTDFKSSNGIEISLVLVLSNFYWFQGSPLRGWQMGGWGRGGYGCVGVFHVCMHAHMYVCMHMHVKHDKHAKHGCLHVSGHLQFLYMCMHVCACLCVHVETTPMPPDTPHPPAPSSEPQGAKKTPKFNKSWTNQDNSILFEDSLPLNIPELIETIIDHPRHPPPTCPTPRAEETQIRRITITLVRIEIIQFCLKIWDPWTSCTHID